MDDPDQELGKILEEEYAKKKKGSQWVEPDENSEEKNREATKEANIDTLPQEVESPESHEQSFNQSPFKQTNTAFPMKHKNSKVPNGPRNDDNTGRPFKPFSYSDITSQEGFHLLPERYIYYSERDENESNENERRNEKNGDHQSSKHSGVPMGRTMLGGPGKAHQSNADLDPQSNLISVSQTTTLQPLTLPDPKEASPQNAVPLSFRPPSDLQLSTRNSLGSQTTSHESTATENGTQAQRKHLNSSNSISQPSSTHKTQLATNSGGKVNSQQAFPKMSLETAKSLTESALPGSDRKRMKLNTFGPMNPNKTAKYAKVINVKSGKKRVIILMLSNRKRSVEVTAGRMVLVKRRNGRSIGAAVHYKPTPLKTPTFIQTKTDLITNIPYPEFPVENITCITFNTISLRKNEISELYHKAPSSCPLTFPVSFSE